MARDDLNATSGWVEKGAWMVDSTLPPTAAVTDTRTVETKAVIASAGTERTASASTATVGDPYTVSSVPVAWVETSTPTGITGDDQAKEFTLPFPVSFFGATYSKIQISSNGLIQFGPCNQCTSFIPQTIPNALAPNGVATVFWRDLYPPAGGSITYLSEPTQFVVTWNNVRNYSSVFPSRQTFQAILKPDGSLTFQYQTAVHDRPTTIGLEHPDGTRGVAYTVKPANNTAIKFTPVGSVVDTTPPTTPVVTDDGVYTTSATQLHATWTSSDPESGIAEYQYAIGTTSGGTEVVNWTSTGTSTEVTKSSLSLTQGATYYLSVKAKNGTGSWSTAGNSDGITVDSTPPTIPVVSDDGLFTISTTELHATWISADTESGVVEYRYAVGSTVGGIEVVPWISVGAASGVTKAGLALANGTRYYISVKARNGAGSWSSIGSSDGITVDATAPTRPVVTDDGASTGSTTQLHASWTSSDGESGIAEYQYQISQDSPTGTVVVDWVSTGTATEVTKAGLSLTAGRTYYFNVKAKNGAGLWSEVGSSDGIRVETLLYTISSVPFQWVETTASTGIIGDDQTKEFTLPFPFAFFGTTFSKIQISSNGFLQFGPCGGCTDYTPDPIPNVSLPNGIAALFWRDLYPPAGGSISYLSDTTNFVVTWNNVRNFTGTSRQTFQAILKPDGSITFQYASVIHDRPTTIGLEHPDGTKGVAYTQKPANNTAIKFTPSLSDFTPPTTPVVTDDGQYTTSTTQLHAAWSSSDPESGISEYQYKITQDSTTGTVVLDWTSAGTATEVTKTGLTLIHGKTYYFSVKAKNGAGSWSAVGTSNGIVVDENAPVISGMTPADGSTFTEQDSVTISVNAADIDGDALEYQFLIDGVVKQPWSSGSSWNWDTTGTVWEHQLTVQVRDPYSRQGAQGQRLFGFRKPIPEPAP